MFFMPSESHAAVKKLKVSISAKNRSEKEKDSGEEEVETPNKVTTTSFQTETESCTLYIKIKNGGDQPITGQMKWCFISDHSSGKNSGQTLGEATPAIFCFGKKEITLPVAAVVEESVVSELFTYEEKTVLTETYNSANEGVHERDIQIGDVYKGYLVLFLVDGKVVAMNSNTSRYRKDAWIEQCRNPPQLSKKKRRKKRR